MKYKIRSLKGYRSGMQYVWGEGSLSGNSIQSCKALRGAEENSFEVENTRLFIRLQAFVLTLTTRKIAMQAIQVTPLRRILLPTPPSALLSSHLLYSSLLVVGFYSKQLQDRTRGCGVVYSKAFSSSRCTFELTVKVVLSESYFQEIFVLQLTSSALKKEKKYKYSYNLVYPSPFLTIDLILVSYGQQSRG